MTRHGLWLATLLLPLSGCYMPPTDAGYGYAQPGYPAGGYAPSPYDPYAGYPGYSESNGTPMYMDGGAPVPLVLYGGEWGFYDSGRHWHRAPEGVSRHMEERRSAGGQFHDNPGAHNESFSQPRSGQPGGQSGFHQAAAPPPAAPRPAPTPTAQPRQENHERHRDCPPGQRC
jgi:hypothetical protein